MICYIILPILAHGKKKIMILPYVLMNEQLNWNKLSVGIVYYDRMYKITVPI